MSEVVDSATLLIDLRKARDEMLIANESAKSAAVDKPRAQIANENAFAHAYVRYREAGDNDQLAKQRALIETAVERQKYLEYHEGLMVAKAQIHAFGELFASYRTIGFVAQQEMKLADG